MLRSHIMQYTWYTLLIMTRRHCEGLVWAALNCLWCFMHGPGPAAWCVFKNAALREQAVQPRCGPVWADSVESADLVSLPTRTDAVHPCLVQNEAPAPIWADVKDIVLRKSVGVGAGGVWLVFFVRPHVRTFCFNPSDTKGTNFEFWSRLLLLPRQRLVMQPASQHSEFQYWAPPAPPVHVFSLPAKKPQKYIYRSHKHDQCLCQKHWFPVGREEKVVVRGGVCLLSYLWKCLLLPGNI